MKIINEHPSLLYASEINNICKPLHKLNITYFGHGKLTNDSQFSAISSHPIFFESYLKNQYYNADLHFAKQPINSKYVIWDSLEFEGQTSVMEDESCALGIRHTFTIIQKSKDEKHFYHFASDVLDKQINQVYLSNIDILELFIKRFNEQVKESNELSKAYDFTFSLDQNSPGYLIKNTNDLLVSQEIKEKIIAELSGCNLSLLSLREKECLTWVIRGKTASEIAHILGLSKRTIESYMINIKNKLGAASKSELIGKVIDLI